MIARFLNERLSFIPVPKTYKNFLDITKATDCLMMKSFYERKTSPTSSTNRFIPGTMKFIGGDGWFIFLCLEVDSQHDTLLLSVEGMHKNEKKGIWESFTSNSTKGIEHTKENLNILKNRILKLMNLISSCKSSKDIFKRLEKGDIGEFLKKVDSEFDR